MKRSRRSEGASAACRSSRKTATGWVVAALINRAATASKRRKRAPESAAWGAARLRLRGKRLGQPALSDPGLASDEDDGSATGERGVHDRRRAPELRLAAHERLRAIPPRRRTRRGDARARPRARRPRRVELEALREE